MKRGLGLAAVVSLAPFLPVAAQDGIFGQVIGPSGRPLPYVVVTSRTSNGFLSAYTNIDGRFAFPNRPHHRGHIIEFRSLGYFPHVVRLDGVTDEITVTLDVADTEPVSGWSVGLATGFDLELLTVDGLKVDANRLRSGQPYQLKLSYPGRARCSRAGPAKLAINGTNVVVAVAVFRKNRNCGSEALYHEQRFDIRLEGTGAGSVRIVGQYDDVLVPIATTAGPTRNE